MSDVPPFMTMRHNTIGGANTNDYTHSGDELAALMQAIIAAASDKVFSGCVNFFLKKIQHHSPNATKHTYEHHPHSPVETLVEELAESGEAWGPAFKEWIAARAGRHRTIVHLPVPRH
jgi:hypothetical protein